MSFDKKRALIVIDVQEEYFSGNLKIEYPDPNISLGNIVNLIDFSKKNCIPVVIVKNVLSHDSPLFAIDGKREVPLSNGQKDHCWLTSSL